MCGILNFLILVLCCISFQVVVVFGLGQDLLFKSVLGDCGVMRHDFSNCYQFNYFL